MAEEPNRPVAGEKHWWPQLLAGLPQLFLALAPASATFSCFLNFPNFIAQLLQSTIFSTAILCDSILQSCLQLQSPQVSKLLFSIRNSSPSFLFHLLFWLRALAFLTNPPQPFSQLYLDLSIFSTPSSRPPQFCLSLQNRK